MKKVCLVGDFNQWEVEADPMQKVTDIFFRITKKLPAGRHEYKFYADGRYWEDVCTREQTMNSFGTRNAVITVE